MQLEKSPHVRAEGRAVFHGSWTRLKRPALDDADSHSSFSSIGELVIGERKHSRSHCHQDSKGEKEVERGERGKRFAIREQRRRVPRGELHRQAAANLPRFAWGLGKKQRGDAGGDGLGGIAVNKNDTACMEPPPNKNMPYQNQKKQKKKRSRKSATVAFVPHGEGYVEFLDGWGVSQVLRDTISCPRLGSLSNECAVSPSDGKIK